MAGLFGISINSEAYKGRFEDDLFWGTFYLQHLGEQYAGLSVCNQGKISIRTHHGLFRPTFENDMIGLDGEIGIGYCGHIREPFFVDSKLGQFSTCLSGNIDNHAELVETFKEFGHTLERGDEAEIVAKLIAQGNDFVDGIQRVHQEVEGSLSMLVIAKEGIYASTVGHWPLTIGQKQGAVVITSDSCGFYNLGVSVLRDLAPGEIVCLKNGQVQTVLTGQDGNHACSFWWVYTAFACGKCKGVAASTVRAMLGANLAKRDIEQGFIPDIVAPIPDSGRFHALGYFNEFVRQINAGRIKRIPECYEVLSKYSYAGRSFTPQTKEERDKSFYKNASK